MRIMLPPRDTEETRTLSMRLGKTWDARQSRFDTRGDDEDLFSGSASRHRFAGRSVSGNNPSPPSSNKVMTPAEFERYRKDKERQDRERQEIRASAEKHDQDPDDEDNYEDDEDDIEKARQQAKQRQKQEAHMTVYRQQMMKVTGEAANLPSRPSLFHIIQHTESAESRTQSSWRYHPQWRTKPIGQLGRG